MKIITVNSCKECPYLTPYNPNKYDRWFKCMKTNALIKPSSLITIDMIQPSCPLNELHQTDGKI